MTPVVLCVLNISVELILCMTFITSSLDLWFKLSVSVLFIVVYKLFLNLLNLRNVKPKTGLD